MVSTLKPGDTAPDFTLPDAEGRAVHLRDQLAAGPVVVYFYPYTGTCSHPAAPYARHPRPPG